MYDFTILNLINSKNYDNISIDVFKSTIVLMIDNGENRTLLLIYANLNDKLKDIFLETFWFEYQNDDYTQLTLSCSLICDSYWKGYIRHTNIFNYLKFLYSIYDKNILLQVILIKDPELIITNNGYLYFCKHALPKTIIKYVKSNIQNKPPLILSEFDHIIPTIFKELNITPTKEDINTMLRRNPTNITEILKINKHEIDNDTLVNFFNGLYQKYNSFNDYGRLNLYSGLKLLLHYEEPINKYFVNIMIILDQIIKFKINNDVIDILIDNFDIIRLKLLTKYDCDIRSTHIQKIIQKDPNEAKIFIEYAHSKRINLKTKLLNTYLKHEYNKCTPSNNLYDIAKMILNFKIMPNEKTFKIAKKKYDKKMLTLLSDYGFELTPTHIEKLLKKGIIIDDGYKYCENDYFKMYIQAEHPTEDLLNNFSPTLRDQIMLREFFRARDYKKAEDLMKSKKLKPDRYCSDHADSSNTIAKRIMLNHNFKPTSFMFARNIKRSLNSNYQKIDCMFMSKQYV